MISIKINYKKLFVSILAIAMFSCSDPWGDRQSDDQNLNVNLAEAIKSNPDLSYFSEALVKTGYNRVLAQSNNYTVFAPTNEAMLEVPNSILNDTDKLVFFVQNHIALSSYSSVRSTPSEKIKMLSNKYLLFNGATTIGDATITDADKYTKNGVFHIVNKALTPKLNIWEYIKSNVSTSSMCKYLVSLNEFNIYKADSIAKATAKQVPGIYSDSLSNSFLKNVYNLNNEKKEYTFFLMEDGGFDSEVDILKPYLTKSNVDSTATYSSYFTVRDMAFPKAYKSSELPTELPSRFGVNVPVDKSQIVGEPIVLSNGIIYIMKKVDVPLENRLVTTKIEGENNISFNPTDLRSKILYRDKKDPITGFYYNDIMVQNQGVSLFVLNYNAKDLYSTTYQVYWRAINDMQTNVFKQKLIIGTSIENNVISEANSLKAFAYTDVPVKLYDEVYIGDFTLDQASDIDLISLLSTVTTTNGNNTLTLDYLKFVPVIK
jgi:hypothetical protein